MPMQISFPRHVFLSITQDALYWKVFISPWHRLCSSFFWGIRWRVHVPLVRVRLLGAVELSKEPFRFRADASTQLRGVSWRYTFLLDGRVVDAESEMSSYRVNPVELADGYHTLKCVAWWIIRCGFMDLIQNRLS